jgi:hypothetical protein
MRNASRRRVLAARRRGQPSSSSTTPARRTSASSWPSRITHDRLDELAAEHDVAFEDGATKPEKIAALEAAGVTGAAA